jgi:hypothetical protein
LLLLIDGPDLTGKSALAARLRDELGFTVVHRTGPPLSSSWIDYGDAPELRSYRPGDGIDVVCDRWHYSEAVWPYVFGRPTDMNAALFSRIEERLSELGAIAVYARRGQSVLEQALLENPDEPVRPDQVEEVLRLYDEVMTMTSLHVETYDFDDTDDYSPIVFEGRRQEEWARERSQA